MYAITCCSTADLPAQFYEKTGISYAKFHFSMNGVEYDDDLGLSISPEEFYQQIRQGALPVTSQVNVQQYEDLFEPILRSGKDLIHLTLSSGISGSIGSARIAARELSERYPNRRIQIIDSLAAASGYGLLVEEAYCRQQEGMSFDQLVSWIEENKLKLHHWIFSRGTSFPWELTFIRGQIFSIFPKKAEEAEILPPRRKWVKSVEKNQW